MENNSRDSRVPLPRNLENQYIRIMTDPEFHKLLEKLYIPLAVVQKCESQGVSQINIGKKYIGNKDTAESGIKRDISKFLIQKRVPINWLQPIFNMLKDGGLDFPLDSGISLKIGSQERTSKAGGVVLITSEDGSLIGDQKSLSIVVTAKVKPERISAFIKRYKKEIKDGMDLLDLPEGGSLRWSKVTLALKIIEMKETGKTFSKIAGILTEDAGLSEKDLDFLGNESNLKTLYYRYKNKYLSFAKK